jgi:hypothetical protein
MARAPATLTNCEEPFIRTHGCMEASPASGSTFQSRSSSLWRAANRQTSMARTRRESCQLNMSAMRPTAAIEETGFWGTLSFTDFFALSRFDGEWKIVNKTFAHTGGEPPAH